MAASFHAPNAYVENDSGRPPCFGGRDLRVNNVNMLVSPKKRNFLGTLISNTYAVLNVINLIFITCHI